MNTTVIGFNSFDEMIAEGKQRQDQEWSDFESRLFNTENLADRAGVDSYVLKHLPGYKGSRYEDYIFNVATVTHSKADRLALLKNAFSQTPFADSIDLDDLNSIVVFQMYNVKTELSVVVTLPGNNYPDGYPVRMTDHADRPYFMDAKAANFAIGIMMLSMIMPSMYRVLKDLVMTTPDDAKEHGYSKKAMVGLRANVPYQSYKDKMLSSICSVIN